MVAVYGFQNALGFFQLSFLCQFFDMLFMVENRNAAVYGVHQNKVGIFFWIARFDHIELLIKNIFLDDLHFRSHHQLRLADILLQCKGMTRVITFIERRLDLQRFILRNFNIIEFRIAFCLIYGA